MANIGKQKNQLIKRKIATMAKANNIWPTYMHPRDTNVWIICKIKNAKLFFLHDYNLTGSTINTWNSSKTKCIEFLQKKDAEVTCDDFLNDKTVFIIENEKYKQ